MQIIPPLDSIYYTPEVDLHLNSKPVAVTAFNILFWAPQIIWGILAALMLLRVLIQKKQRRFSLAVVIPYVMVLMPIMVLLLFFQIRLGPLRPHDPRSQGLNRALFKHDASPSLLALPSLVALHVATSLWLRRRHQ